VIATYLSQRLFYTMQQIIKNLSDYKNGSPSTDKVDAFAEWRRLDYPQLTAGVSTVLDGKMPSRFF
jgi:hypothetical protein